MFFKRCSCCNQLKSVNEYYKQKATYLGVRSYCKNCYKQKQKKWGENYDKEKKKLNRKNKYTGYLSEKGRKRKMFDLIVGRSRRDYGYYKNIKCEITWQQFEDFISKSEYHLLYKNWAESGFSRKLMPSIDRLDPKKNYTLGNIRVTTLHQNLTRRGVLLLN